ncbi:hypothetical protein RJ639_027347 [Escallonia herrerae]|uniref:Rho GTPase activating protein n=1 Tax=Escallonia herrerae TaxID=1293975 RepID=A0AA89BE63_9ASTE|nr:hypothetical protein RJ639_027347 [Escallonia herrerae]
MTRLFRSKSCGVGAQSAFASSPPPSPSLYLTNDDDDEEEEEEEEEDEEFDGGGGYFGNNRITTPFIVPDGRQQGQGSQLPVLAVLAAALRKSLVTCSVETDDASSLDIGSPKDVRHVSHVTFDRFNGFLGLPVELEPEVSPKVPSARYDQHLTVSFPVCVMLLDRGEFTLARLRNWMLLKSSLVIYGLGNSGAAEDAIIDESVPKCKYEGKSLLISCGDGESGIKLFCRSEDMHGRSGACPPDKIERRVGSVSIFGVSAQSMQCSYDQRGNSVPTILLMMQKRLYSEGGLKAEGIFRINAENSQEDYVRNQLNKGLVPRGIDIHCLAGLIKAWFRELPSGILDSLTPEQVVHCNTEEECTQLVKSLPPTEDALLDWAINLMADVVQHEHLNKMNARNVAMVFAPNMTQVSNIAVESFALICHLFPSRFLYITLQKKNLNHAFVNKLQDMTVYMVVFMMIDMIISLFANFGNISHRVNKLVYTCMMQMADPLTALIHAVQVMNFLKTLITKTLRERLSSCSDSPSSKGVGHSFVSNGVLSSEDSFDGYAHEQPDNLQRSATLNRHDSKTEEKFWSFQSRTDAIEEYESISCRSSPVTCKRGAVENDYRGGYNNGEEGILDRLNLRKGIRKLCRHPVFQLSNPAKKIGGLGIVHTRGGGGEAWT